MGDVSVIHGHLRLFWGKWNKWNQPSGWRGCTRIDSWRATGPSGGHPLDFVRWLQSPDRCVSACVWVCKGRVCVCVCGPVCKVHLSPSVSSLKVLDGWNVGCVTACVCGSVCPDGMDVRVCKVWTCVSTYWVCKVMCPCVLEIVGCVRSASQLSVCRSGRVCNPSGVYDLVGGCEKNHSSNWVCKQLDGCGWVSNHLHSKHECVSV